eukprot:TRINITY_DN8477_c0_g1_i1.p1 TRINITY_DN8477_c0_g1~~TRINITY_DN8477_c0_g1_i1.p1  ORF type:complete len:494 (-),score=158.45 TRINITY_DN8477_c0_g1_i1:239-1720(-)
MEHKKRKIGKGDFNSDEETDVKEREDSSNSTDNSSSSSSISMERFALDCLPEPLLVLSASGGIDFINNAFKLRFGELKRMEQVLDLLWDPGNQKNSFQTLFQRSVHKLGDMGFASSSFSLHQIHSSSGDFNSEQLSFVFLFKSFNKNVEGNFSQSNNPAKSNDENNNNAMVKQVGSTFLISGDNLSSLSSPSKKTRRTSFSISGQQTFPGLAKSGGNQGDSSDNLNEASGEKGGFYRARVVFHPLASRNQIILTFKEIVRTSFAERILHTRKHSFDQPRPMSASSDYVTQLKTQKHSFLEKFSANCPLMSSCVELNPNNLILTRQWCNEAFASRLHLTPDQVVGMQLSPDHSPGLHDIVRRLAVMDETSEPLMVVVPTAHFINDGEGATEGADYVATFHYLGTSEINGFKQFIQFGSDSNVQTKLMRDRETQILLLNTIFENNLILMGVVDVDFEREDWRYVVANNAFLSYFPDHDEFSIVDASAKDDLKVSL